MQNELNDKASDEALVAANNACKKEGYGKHASIKIYLLVEGSTDEEFIERLNIKDLMCIGIGPAREARERQLEQKRKFEKDEKYSSVPIKWSYDIKKMNKASIKNIVEHQHQEGFYGLVDKDFDTPQKIQAYHENIMVTPKHDLETTLLSTDEAIFGLPEYIKTSFENALRLAYSIGVVNKYLFKEGYRKLSLECIEHKHINDYEHVIDIQEQEIKLKELIRFMIKDENKPSEQEIEDFVGNIYDDGLIDFTNNMIIKKKDLYDVANGHDIANIMKLLCKDTIAEFIKKHNATQHGYRAIEFAIIDKYNLTKFVKSPLYKELVNRKFIPSANEFFISK